MTQISSAEAPYWATLEPETVVTGRYVKFAVALDEGELSLLNELRVSGLMLSSDESSEPGTMSTVTLAGSFNDWNTTPNMETVDVDNVAVTLSLDAGVHTFKILYGNVYYGSDSTIVDTTLTCYESGLILDSAAGEVTLSATRSGNYRFTFNKVTQALTIEYIPGELYLRGSFNDWGTELPMTGNGDGTYSATVTLEPGDYEFLVANGDFSSKWPANNYALNIPQKANVTVTLDIYTNVIVVNQEIVAYTVTFVDYDGTVLSTQAVAAGGSATAPAVDERDGYTARNNGADVLFTRMMQYSDSAYNYFHS